MQKIQGIEALHSSGSVVTLKYEPSNFQMLLSPDGTQQALPCDVCRSMFWIGTNVVSFICAECEIVTPEAGVESLVAIGEAAEDRIRALVAENRRSRAALIEKDVATPSFEDDI